MRAAPGSRPALRRRWAPPTSASRFFRQAAPTIRKRAKRRFRQDSQTMFTKRIDPDPRSLLLLFTVTSRRREMRNLKIGWKLLLALAVFTLPLRVGTAQGTGSLRGTVSDSTSQQPVAGAQVQLVGTNRATSTDAAGVYRFTGVPSGQASVRVQRIGFSQRTTTVTVTDGATAAADIVLQPVVTTLSQVVVVGYGSSSRAEVTGALSTVQASDIRGTPIAGLDAALQGKAAGGQGTQNTGNPGNGISVRVRGASSLTAGNQPLYVIDGMPVQTGDFSQADFGGQDVTAVTNLNPDAIESITILKAAESAGIYGSRASNGVVLVTTKRGISGTNRITFSGYTGWQKAEKQVKMMS